MSNFSDQARKGGHTACPTPSTGRSMYAGHNAPAPSNMGDRPRNWGFNPQYDLRNADTGQGRFAGGGRDRASIERTAAYMNRTEPDAGHTYVERRTWPNYGNLSTGGFAHNDPGHNAFGGYRFDRNGSGGQVVAENDGPNLGRGRFNTPRARFRFGKRKGS